MTQYHQAKKNIYAPWGKIPSLQPSCQEKDLDFILPRKKHLFLEHISREIFKRFFPTRQNEIFLTQFFSFFQHFCPQHPPHIPKNTQIGDDESPKPIDFSLFDQGHDNSLLDKVISSLQPWRKGPFCFYGKKIHSEWQSQKKWQRVEKALDSLSLKEGHILDIGCNNGYYLFQLLQQKKTSTQKIIGIEPTNTYFLQYLFLMRIFSSVLPHLDKVHYFPVGYQDLAAYFQPTFSLVLCMGILYHHPHPLQIIEITKNILKKGGWAIFEVQGIEQSAPVSLFAPKTYAGKKGFWFLPTLDTLRAWLQRCGFTKITTIDSWALTTQEQQSNKDSPFASLEQGLNAQKNQTIEGYPPPHRYLVAAQR